MKSDSESVPLPEVTKEAISASIPKDKVIYLRVTEQEKQSVKEAAKHFRLTEIEYLMRCHALVWGRVQSGGGEREG